MSTTTARVLRAARAAPVPAGVDRARSSPTGSASPSAASAATSDRLRELGYPVEASKGVGGGYRLGAGRALPPLLLDAEEAVAVAVCLRLAAGGTVAGVGEAALRTLTKLDQVLPGRLRAQVAAVHEATETLDTTGATVDPDVLLTLARASRDRRRVRFSYVARGGDATERLVEPYRMVATGRRWYLLAYDVDRDDWRTFRLDRMREVTATTWGFTARRRAGCAASTSPGRSPSRRTGTSPGSGSTPPRSQVRRAHPGHRRAPWSRSTTASCAADRRRRPPRPPVRLPRLGRGRVHRARAARAPRGDGAARGPSVTRRGA